MRRPYEKNPYRMPQVRQVIRNYLPNFCWQTYHEILTFLELINEDVCPKQLRVELNRMMHCGEIERRRTDVRHMPNYRRHNIFEYKRVGV